VGESQPNANKPAAGSTAQIEWCGFSDTWIDTFSKIFIIRMIWRRVSIKARVHRNPAMFMRWIGLSFGPALVSIPLAEAIDGRLWPFSIRQSALFALLAIINGGMFAAPFLAWRYAATKAGTIDELLRPCRERERITSLIGRAAAPRRQAFMPVLLGILPAVITLLHGRAITWTAASLTLLLNTTWSMAVLGNVAYWLLVPPLLASRMRKCNDLALRWNDPAHTPGIRTLSLGFAYSACYLALGALAVTAPGIFHYPIFDPYTSYLYALLAGLSAWVGVYTHINIYFIVQGFKLRILDDLATQDKFVVTPDRSSEILEKLENKPVTAAISMYDKIATAPAMPYGTGVVVPYLSAIAGSVVAFLLQ
jgi:hypothetical protein